MKSTKKPDAPSDKEIDAFLHDFNVRADERIAWLKGLEQRVAHLLPAEREAALDKLIAEEEPKFQAARKHKTPFDVGYAEGVKIFQARCGGEKLPYPPNPYPAETPEYEQWEQGINAGEFNQENASRS